MATATSVGAAALAAPAANPNPTTPPFSNDVQWITAYLGIHMLSVPSRRYTYYLWFAVAFVVLVFAVLHWTRARGGFIGACWSRWALRRATWKKRRARKGEARQPRRSMPSNAQLFSITVIFAATACLSCVGPDYIRPDSSTWGISRRWDPLQFIGYAPQYTIQKAWWTAGGRTGLIAFALFPLCVLFALKAPPFALFALPFTTQLHFDKLAFLHRWTARIIWLLSTLHVVFWSLQLLRDRKTSPFVDNKAENMIAYAYAWSYTRFIFAWIAYGLLTLVILLSISPLRKYHYETFYYLHILLVPLTLVMAALHHPPVWWWCWAALALWVGERLWRGGRWMFINGLFGQASQPLIEPKPFPLRGSAFGSPKFSQVAQADQEFDPYYFQSAQKGAIKMPSPIADPQSTFSRINQYPPQSAHSPATSLASKPPSHYSAAPSRSSLDMFLETTSSSYTPPPGFVHAELLAGRTVRLTFVPPRPLSWAPGQHFLIMIPAVAPFLTHPFTAASISDSRAPNAAGRAIVLLVRAKSGWTRDLWDEVAAMLVSDQVHPRGERVPEGTIPPRRGVLMRMYVDGPFGSAVRADWGVHSTALIVTGGSGVSFGLSVLEYLCLCMAGRDGKQLGGRSGGWGKKNFHMSKIHFVWLVREFAHIQWCASILRRCKDLIPAPELQIDIFVTNGAIPIGRSPPAPSDPRMNASVYSTETYVASPPPKKGTPTSPGFLAPPAPHFSKGQRQDSVVSDASMSDSGEIDLSYYIEAAPAGDDADSDVDSIMDLTNFDGDDDTAIPGEKRLSRQVKQAGRHKRTMSRRMEKGYNYKQAHAERQAEKDRSRPPNSSRHRWELQTSTDRDRIRMINPSGPALMAAVSEEDPYHAETEPEHGFGYPFGSPPTPKHQFGQLPSSRPASEASHDYWDEGTATVVHSPTSRAWDDASSTHGLVRPGSAASSQVHLREERDRAEQVRLDVDQQEMHDINVMSEYTRNGRPKLDRILADEVEGSKGSVVVACCGPMSLNAVMRNVIASQINPSRIRRGDMRGHITFVSEEFSY